MGELGTLLYLADTLQVFEPDKVWFTSDTHFYHENILRYCNRPFRDISEMNEALVRNWNEAVPPDGVIFHLGDFAFGGAEEWEDILNRLNGQIYLILGNHDMKHIQQGVVSRFTHITQQMTIRVGSRTILLNHYPFLSYGGAYKKVWQLFGHVHSGPLSVMGKDTRCTNGKDLLRLGLLLPRQYDVGVDNNDFHPVSFHKVKAIIEGQIASAELQTREKCNEDR